MKSTCTVKVTHNLPDPANTNLNAKERVSHIWHQRLAHVGKDWTVALSRPTKGKPEHATPPPLPLKHNAGSIDAFKCAACFLSKQNATSSGAQHASNNPDKELAIQRQGMQPGEQVCACQYVWPTGLPTSHQGQGATHQAMPWWNRVH